MTVAGAIACWRTTFSYHRLWLSLLAGGGPIGVDAPTISQREAD
jgi:hypothetical protein